MASPFLDERPKSRSHTLAPCGAVNLSGRPVAR
jgi:hypothetical protein